MGSRADLVRQWRLADWDVPDALRFYSRGRGEPEYRDLSNFAPSPITLGARYDPLRIVTYSDVETAFQAGKATDQRTHDWITQATSPMDAKRRGNDRARVQIVEGWDGRIAPLWMLACLRVKFQIPEFRQLLESTGDRVLVEYAPRDAIWGGWDHRTGRFVGQNLLGRALMRVRAENRGLLTP